MRKKLETKAEKAKKWVKDHKKELMLAGAIAGSFVLGVIFNECSNKKLKKEVEGYTLGDPDKRVKFIDTDIFTSLAPAIEEAVITDGIDRYSDERSYPVEFESGDVRIRKVAVTIEDMGQYEGE